MRLIDADALMKDIIKRFRCRPYIEVGNKCEYVHDILDEQPTIEAMEVVHGEWEKITDDWSGETIYSCSVCKEDFVTIDGTPTENLYNFCPNCGARMDGVNDMNEEYIDENHPCKSCSSDCDRWEAQFCCRLCQYNGCMNCDDCDPRDI